jgi:copper chaperone CopZ
MTARTRTRISLAIDGLTGAHAVRAVWTALGAVPGIVSADVSLAGVQLEIEGVLDEAVLGPALEAAGVTLRSVTIVQPRILPIL